MVIQQRADFPVSRWSGGTTTELFLYPEGATYAARDFSVRISTATVETEFSEFTALPGYARMLMVLEGNLTMVHETPDETLRTELAPFEIAQFDGGWKTTGFGKVTDFNVMLSEGYWAVIEPIRLQKRFAFVAGSTGFRTLLYVFSGSLLADGATLGAGSVVVLTEQEELHLDAETDAVFLVVTVFFE